jgi:hypothetical protein
MWNPLKKRKLSTREILDRNRPSAESAEVADSSVQREDAFTRFINSMVDRALREGKSIEDILSTDFGSLNSSAGETQDCLKPLEVLQHSQDRLPHERMEHVRRCSWCMTLIACALPVEDEFAMVREWARPATMPMAASAGYSFDWGTSSASAQQEKKLFRG